MNSTGTGTAYIKSAKIIAIRMDTTESYKETGHSTVWGTGANPYDASDQTAYIWAHGLEANTGYKVAYYDGDPSGGGQKVATDDALTSTAYGNLSSQYTLNTDENATAGIWHAVVFYTSASPPTDYNQAAAITGYVVEDRFQVAATAIPEFSTVMTAIAVAGLCFGIYYWMRKRRLAYVQA